MTSTVADLAPLRDAVRAALTDLSPPAEVRRQMSSARGWDPAMWRRLCGELGVAGTAVPETYGGSGLSAVELGVVFAEAGRSLLCAPLLACAGLAVPLLLATADGSVLRSLLPPLCAGESVVTVAVADAAGRTGPERERVRAEPDGDGWRLDGTAGFVVDGASADLVLVPVVADGAGLVLAVPAGAPGLSVAPLVSLDQTRRLARLVFTGVAGSPVGPAHPVAVQERALDVARAMLACEQAGGAQRCLEVTVEYARTRVQFGRPIGSFQAVKHRCADMLVLVESARSAAEAAAAAVCSPAADEAARAVCVASTYCAEAFQTVAADMIQLHGGIGFTWEHDAHLYLKRARTGAELLGRPAEHVERLAGLVADL